MGYVTLGVLVLLREALAESVRQLEELRGIAADVRSIRAAVTGEE